MSNNRPRPTRDAARVGWSAEAWPEVKTEFKKACAEESDPGDGVVLLRPFAFRKLVLLSSSIVLTDLPPERMMTEL